VAVSRESGRPAFVGWSLVLLLSALSWRAVRYALVFPMWGDEGMLAVNFYDRSFAGLLGTLEYGQVAPPGFLWLELASSRLLGFSEPALRLLPFLAGIGATVLFWVLARKLLDRRSALLSVAVFAASFYPVRYAAEVKPYSFDLLLALAIVLAAWSVYERPRAKGRWALFALLGAAAAWLSYPSIFVSAGACAWLLAFGAGSRVRGQWLPWAAALLIVASFLAMYVLAGAGQRDAAPTSYWAAGFPPISRPWLIPLWALDVHTGMMMAYPNGGHSGGSVVSFLLAVVGGVVLWRTRRPVLWLLLSPLPFMFLAAALERYPYGASARVAQHVAPAACLLIGTGILCVLRKVLGRRRAVRALPLAILPFLAVAIGGIVRDVARPYHSRADLQVREIFAELAMESTPGDQWIVYASRDASGLAPPASRFVGMGGRIQFQILSRSPARVLWAPDPSSVAGKMGQGTVLITYGNRVFESDPDRSGAYADAISDRLGAKGSETRHDLPDGEWIEIVRWP
jgi:hypothetical protein